MTDLLTLLTDLKNDLDISIGEFKRAYPRRYPHKLPDRMTRTMEELHHLLTEYISRAKIENPNTHR